MASTLDLRSVLQAKLSTYCNDAFYRKAKGDHVSSWLVYDVEDFSYNELFNQVKLEVNLMKKGEDTSALETLADSVWEGLDHWDYIDTNMAFSTYQNVRNNIEEEGLKHIRLVFSIKLFR